MKFKVQKIHQVETKIKNKWWRKFVRLVGPKFAVFITIGVGLAGVFWLGSLVLNSDLLFKGTRHLFSFSSLPSDKYGHTNVLILGVGGNKAQGGFLTDSIMIASFDPEEPSVSFLNIPRDMFASSKELGNHKINEMYAIAKKNFDERKSLEVTKQVYSELTGVDIHYATVIDFNVFKEVVDALGGIEVFVTEDIVDPFYPDKNYGYQTFVVRKGLQKFDGETALKYARSRKTSSDYSRAHRQQEIILAIKEKAEKEGFLSNMKKLGQLYDIYKTNVNTDMGLVDLYSLGKIAMEVDYKDSISAVLNNDPTKPGGFLYTPDKAAYGGQFVSLPVDDRDTKFFVELSLLYPEVLTEKAQIAVLNGSKIEGIANGVSNRLKRFGFHVIEVGNYETEVPVQQSFIKVVSSDFDKVEKTADFLEKFLHLPVQKETKKKTDDTVQNDPSLIDIQIILGTNWKMENVKLAPPPQTPQETPLETLESQSGSVEEETIEKKVEIPKQEIGRRKLKQ